jgi:16S rRNA C967 or C1407 C5-methylase (RsmB/RsmF family)
MPNKIPKDLNDKLKSIYTPAEMKVVNSGFKIEKRLPSFRINTIKAHEVDTIASLEKEGLKIKKIDFLENAYQLEEGREKDLWDTGAFKAGYIYMQSLSSQVPVACM